MLLKLAVSSTVFVHLVFPFLAPDIVYEFRVQAETTVGTGPFSTSRSFTTPEDGIVAFNYNSLRV